MPLTKRLLQKQLNWDDWMIILANLLPVAGSWFLGWSAVEAFIVYALETVIIGLLTVIKLLVATAVKRTDSWHSHGITQQVSGLFFIFFFVLHFGIFVAVQMSIFSGVAGINPPGQGALYFFLHWWEFINEDIAYMLGGFIVSYLVRDLVPFLYRKDYKTIPMMILMFQPYGRILVQQFTVILGSMFLTFHLGRIFILVFALVKIFVEIFLNFERLLGKAIDDQGKVSGEQ